MLKARKQGWTWGALLLVFGLGGCSTLSGTRVDQAHHLVSASSEPLFATVYFIRPQTERAMGFADNALTVKVDGRTLLTIEKGDYTLVYLRPRVNTAVTLENQTEVGPTISSNSMSDADTPNWIQRGTWPVKRMSKTYDLDFAAGKTYYLMLEPVDGEFRGVHFTVHNAAAFAAKEVVQDLRAVGAARSVAISTF